MLIPARLILSLDFFVVAEAMIDSQFISLLESRRNAPLVAEGLALLSQADKVLH